MISIVIPTYNRENVIKECVESILCQTYEDFEIIIVDDGSTDRTKKIVQQVEDSRLHYIYQDNQGACVARNHGIEAAKGEYIAFQDSDDKWEPKKLEKQLQVLLTNDNVDIVCCKSLCKRLDGSIFESMRDVGDGWIDKKRGPGGITTQTLLMRKNVTDQVKFDSKVTRYQDLDFLLMAQKKGFQIYCLDETLVTREIGVDSITNHPERVLQMSWYFEEKYPEIIGQQSSFLSHFFSGVLMQTGQELYERKDKSYRDYFLRAFQLERGASAYAKYILIRSRIYPLYRKVIERCF